LKRAAAICLVLVTLTLCAAFLMSRGQVEAGRSARGALEAVKSVLHVTPTVAVSSYIATQKTSDILELATVSKGFPIEYSFTHTFMGSTKSLKLRGDYTVKAGFDLREKFSLQVGEAGDIVFADFPGPKILSVQMNRYAVLEDQDGWWNVLTPRDREDAVNAMNALARKSALEMGVLPEAKAAVTKRLLEYGGRLKWEITFRDSLRPE